jgi:hypothetical protein
MMGDITSKRVLYLKAGLFLALGGLAVAIALARYPDWRLAALMAIAIWAFCRAYYFAFYVLCDRALCRSKLQVCGAGGVRAVSVAAGSGRALNGGVWSQHFQAEGELPATQRIVVLGGGFAGL